MMASTRNSVVMLVIVLVINCWMHSTIAKQITFRAENRVIKKLDIQPQNNFREWFHRSQMIETILRANPGIEHVEKVSDDVFEGKLSALQFPGLKVIPTIRFNAKLDENGLEVRCTEDSLKQEYEGSKLFASWLSKLLPKVASCNKCSYNDVSNELTNEATLEIKFNLPSWFPIAAHIIDEKGSAVIQQGLNKDMTALIDNVINIYNAQVSNVQKEEVQT